MPGFLLLLRAYKLKRAAKRLRRAKENALRVHRGERPRYPCHEECCTWCCTCLRDSCCNTFCPCCVHPRMRTAIDGTRYADTFWRRPCVRGTFDNLCLKSVLGFLAGLVLTTGIFLFLLHQLNIDPRTTTAACCLVGVVLTNGLAFSPEFRCTIMLAMPGLFSSRGRMVLLTYIYILVMSGPAKNALRNANILVNSLNCGKEMVSKQAKAILKTLVAPLVAILDIMRDILKALKDFAKMLKEAFIAIRDLFLEIINAIQIMFEWLLSVVEVCADKYGSPYQRCNGAFESAARDCRDKMGAFGFLCEIVSAVQYVCEMAKIVDLLCMLSKAVKIGIIEPLKEHFKSFARYMYTQFYVNVTFVHYYNYSLEQSKSFKDIRGDIQAEIRERTEWLVSLIDWSNLSSALVIFVLLFKAYVYRVRYLTADHFDNVYITHQVRDIDERRADRGRETILPLTIRERMRYVHPFSVRMAAAERRKFAVAFLLLFLSGIQMGFNMLIDYSLYRLLDMLRVYGAMAVKGQVPAVVQIRVKGSGVMSDMYRQMVSQFEPLMKTSPDFDLAQCLPNPIPIDVDKYRMIGLLYLVCVCMSACESYGLRLRHVICAAHHPARERLRAVWLYNHILRTRGGLKGFLRRQIRRRMYGDDSVDEVTLLEALAARHRWLGKLANWLGLRSGEHCVGCGRKVDEEGAKKCANPGCKGIYCLACFEDLDNVCTLCTKPVEYEDVSDISEEKDSSDEEMAKEDESDDDDYDYQFDDREQSDDDEVSISQKNVRHSKTRKELASLEDFSEEEIEEFDV
ncbi:hypothetical protein JTE90_026380 [Oedothorax gibbosus]|uniref:Dendritic cell-specific transmembrane protein-like domain-containing protein n=1 Tax=Oedothorax gibbosus TaxID=931172 RepID=A0AAV6VG89_9ARAC|nr:hypothetical protein JTE90_026380 [Oedothorax gibbosus]